MNTSTTYAKFLLLAALLLGSFAPMNCNAGNLKVLVVLSDANTPYQTFARTFVQNLPVNIEVSILERAEDFPVQTPAVDLLVTVGVKATELLAAKTTTPLLAVMIPANTYPNLLSRRPRASLTSAIYLDQPWARQIDFLQAALPERSNIGVLHSADSSINISALRAELSRHGMTLTDKTLQKEDTLFADLQAVLASSDVLLAVADKTIYNSRNIRNILLSSYRRGVPLIGLSQSYVRAGALCAIYSTPEHLAAQASATSLSYAQTHKLPEAQYPALYSIAVNQAVARTLGINLQTAELLQLQVEKAQRKTP